MISISDELKVRLISGIVLFSAAVFIISIGGAFYVATVILISLFCAAELFTIIGKAQLSEQEARKWLLKGVFLIGASTFSLYAIREIFSSGTITAFWFFIMVSMVDTFAYFIGKFIGKHKLAPKISPNKTIEGFIGGVTLATIASMGFYYFFNSKLNMIAFIIMSLVIGILAQVSDLMESYFKRKFNVKDSSNLIPGHGGFLDRMDGYLLTAPAIVIFYFIFKAVFGVAIFY